MYPNPVISRAYVPGPDADPATPGKYNFWEAVGLSYYTPRMGPLQADQLAPKAMPTSAERHQAAVPRRTWIRYSSDKNGSGTSPVSAMPNRSSSRPARRASKR